MSCAPTGWQGCRIEIRRTRWHFAKKSQRWIVAHPCLRSFYPGNRGPRKRSSFPHLFLKAEGLSHTSQSHTDQQLHQWSPSLRPLPNLALRGRPFSTYGSPLPPAERIFLSSLFAKCRTWEYRIWKGVYFNYN